MKKYVMMDFHDVALECRFGYELVNCADYFFIRSTSYFGSFTRVIQDETAFDRPRSPKVLASCSTTMGRFARSPIPSSGLTPRAGRLRRCGTVMGTLEFT